MQFGSPKIVYLFALAIMLFLIYVFAFRKEKKDAERFAERRLLGELAAGFDPGKRRIKAVFLILAFSFAVLALMRPKWGYHWEEVKRKGLDIIIALDTSKSMLAEDVRPNRFERSKLAIHDLVKKLKGDRIGLIAFAGTAFLQCPLTVDYNGFLLSLDALEVGSIPKEGTSISSAINETIKSYEGAPGEYKILIIITDGEDHEGDPLKTARKAKKDGITIFAIGIGTEEGELIPVTDESGRFGFLKDREGNVVKTRLDEKTLQEIALETGGSYVHSTSTEFGLDLIYEKKLSKFEKREIESKMKKHYEERFQIPLAVAFLLLALELFITDRKRKK